MKIQFVSDLHLEFPENRAWLKRNPLIPKGDVLLMAGDIVPDKKKKKARFFYDQITKDFPFIISTMGNHEFYNGTIDYAYPFYRGKQDENFIRLNNQSHVIKNVKFIVSTLWSSVAETKKNFIATYMNDYHRIFHENDYPLSIDDTSVYHKLSCEYISSELEKPFEGKIVVMTHHLPSFDCISESRKGHEMNPAYASNLNELIITNPKIKYWVCGHLHDFNRTTIGKTQIIRNPLGYVFENQQEDFCRDLVVEI